MKSLRQAIQQSWIPEMKIVNRDVGIALKLPQPLSLTDFTRFFDKPETLVFRQPIDSDALHGNVECILRSDGSYTFRGHMRATGFPSFAYKIQVFVRSVGVMIASKPAVVSLEQILPETVKESGTKQVRITTSASSGQPYE